MMAPEIRLRSLFRRDLCDAPGPILDGACDMPMLAALAALIAGEPRRARRIVDEAGAEARAAPEWAEAVRRAAQRLDTDWWPGDTSVGTASKSNRPDVPPLTGHDRLDLLLAVPARIEPDLMQLRTMARSLARLHPGEAEHLLRWASEDLEALLQAAARIDVTVAAAIALEMADLDRLCGADASAGERLSWARLAYQRTDVDAGLGRCLLLEAEWMTTPRGSFATLGFDLDDLNAARPPLAPEVVQPARDRIRRARRLFRRGAAPRGVAATHMAEACLDLLTCHPHQAERRLGQGRELAVGAGDTAAMHLFEVQAVIAAVARGRLSAAESSSTEAMARWAHTSGSLSYGRGLMRLLRAAGGDWRRSGQLEEARVTLSLALHLAERLGAADEQLSILAHDLTPLYSGINSLGPAITHYRRALRDCMDELGLVGGTGPDDSPHWLRLASVITGMTPLMMADGNPDGLAHAAELARALLTRVPRETLPFEGWIDEHPEWEQEAARLLRAGASSLLEDREPPDVEGFGLSIAIAHLAGLVALADVFVPIYRGRERMRDGDAEEARHQFSLALDRARGQGAKGRRNQVSALIALGRWDEAQHLLIDLVTQEDPARNAADWGWVRAYDRAAAEVHRIPTHVTANADWRQLAGWAADLARVDDAAAEQLLGRAIASLEALISRTARDAFRLSLLTDPQAHDLYAMAARLAGRGDRLAEAFARADRLRCLRLDMLLRAVAARAGHGPRRASALRRWLRASAQWTGAYDEFASLGFDHDAGEETAHAFLVESQRRLEEAESGLERVAPGFLTGGRHLSPPTRLEEAQSLLPAGTLLVVYLGNRDTLQIWAVDRDRATATERPIDPDHLLVRARRFHDYCAARRLLPDKDDGAWLAHTLLDAVAPDIRDHPRLLVVPSGPMDLVPFHALPFGDGVLGARHAVSLLPATSVLAYSAGHSHPRLDRGALVVGDPAYAPTRGLPPLPGTLHEARAVAARYGRRALTREHATAAGVSGRASKAAVIHLATHGLVSATAPTLSSVALAGDDELTVAELMGLSIDADLVVLSACDTGRREDARAGGVAGLIRGLLTAGARNAIVSLWPVDDAVTCVLMERLADGIAGGATIAEALMRAQHAVRTMDAYGRSAAYRALQRGGRDAAPPRRQRSARDVRRGIAVTPPPDHPYWWAPFVHVGA